MALPPDTPLVQAIRSYLARTGESPRALSLRIGRNDTLVRKILSGVVRAPHGENLTRLAAVIGVPPEALVPAGLGSTPAPRAPPPVAAHPASQMAALARGAAHEAIQNAGPRLRATRQALGIRTVDELAAEIGADPADVARWEEGLPPDLAALAVLKLRRGVPLDWLLLGDDTSLPPLLLHALVQHGGAGLAFRGGLPRGALPEQNAPQTPPRSVHDAPYAEGMPPRST